MARRKPWIDRIPQILKLVQESECEAYYRQDVEKLFLIGRSAALDLMNIVGAKLLDAGLATSKNRLAAYLTISSEAQEATRERTRRASLAETLSKAAADQRLRAIELPGVRRDIDYLLKDLANVSIHDGVCTVVFSDAQDLMAQLYKLVQAAAGDWDLFAKVCKHDTEKAS